MFLIVWKKHFSLESCNWVENLLIINVEDVGNILKYMFSSKGMICFTL
jgi:hypothetical protein